MAKEAVEFRGFGAVFGGRMYKTCKWISYVEGRGGGQGVQNKHRIKFRIHQTHQRSDCNPCHGKILFTLYRKI